MKLYEESDTPYPPTNFRATLDEVELHLAACCAITNDGQWLVKQDSGRWEFFKSKKSAALSMNQNWLGGKLRVTAGDIKTFMAETVPVLAGGLKVPTSKASVITCFGAKYINTWFDTIMKPNKDVLSDMLTRNRLTLLMRMIRESLCGMPDVMGLDEMIAVLHGDDPNEIPFRFTMQWLAAPLQNVGLNLQTNLWHVGELNGTGKGTLSMIMQMIYDFSNSALMSQEEVVKGGWSDALDGKLWVAINEMRQSNDFDWNSFIKENSTEAVLRIRKRNNDSYAIINFGNWYITGNKETAPWGALDTNDRRNAIFATTTDPEKAKLALDFRDYMEHNPDEAQQVFTGFVHILHIIPVSQALLVRAPETAIKREMQDAVSPETDGVYWLQNDQRCPRDVWMPARDYLDYYKQFMQCPNLTPRRFSFSVLGKLARKGHIERQQTSTATAQFRIPSKKYPTSGPTYSTNAIIPFPKSN